MFRAIRYDSPMPMDLPRRRLFEERSQPTANPYSAARIRLNEDNLFVKSMDKGKSKAIADERGPLPTWRHPIATRPHGDSRSPIASTTTKNSLSPTEKEQPLSPIEPRGEEKPLPSLPKIKRHGRPTPPPRDDVLYHPPILPRLPTPDNLPPSRFSDYSSVAHGMSDEDKPIWRKWAVNLAATLPRNFGNSRG